MNPAGISSTALLQNATCCLSARATLDDKSDTSRHCFQSLLAASKLLLRQLLFSNYTKRMNDPGCKHVNSFRY